MSSGFRASRPTPMAGHYMVSSGHYLATKAALAILDAGGNAIDAGVAGGLALGVVQSDLVNIAGVAPIMIRTGRDGAVTTIDGLGVWPRAANLDWFGARGHAAVPPGVQRQIVPAAPAAWIAALARFGTMRFHEVADPAITLARDGFPLPALMADQLAAHADDYRRWPQNAAIYLPGGAPPAAGELFRQADLAASLRYMADQDRAAGDDRAAGLAAAHNAFYRGDIAARIAAFHAAEGGWLTREDLAAFQVREEPPVRVPFAGLEVFTCGPWCQGPMLAQALRLLDPDGLRRAGWGSVDERHQIIEVLKLAFADREAFFGDPAFVEVPLETLLSDDYIAARRAQIDPDRAAPDLPPAGEIGAPVPLDATAFADTSYICVTDADGNAFSATPSDGSYDAPVVPGTGLVPSGRGSQSRLDPGHPAVLAPGKRPRLTPNPAIAARAGADGFVLPFGTPGADVQCQAMLQVLVNHVVHEMDLQAAVEAPRIATLSAPASFAPHGRKPGVVVLEDGADPDLVAGLEARGHIVEWWPRWHWQGGTVCAIRRDGATGIAHGAADPRRVSAAMGW